MSTEPRETELDEEGLPGSAGHFTAEQVAQLNARLDRKLLKSRMQSGQSLTYIEGYTAINQANAIFGYGSWAMRVDQVWQVTAGKDVLHCALVTVNVTAPDGSVSAHQDVGAAIANYSDKVGGIRAESHETALKGAVTDGMKRAFRAYGEQWANNLYDKSYMQARAEEERQAAQATAQRSRPSVTVQEPPAPRQLQPQTNAEAEAAALETQHRRLYNAAQRDQEGKAMLLAYLQEQGKTRITDLTMAEATEWLLVMHDREVMPGEPVMAARA